ncbi:MAG: DUF4258 domain-containing protein [Elusimicrobiota bacterium]
MNIKELSEAIKADNFEWRKHTLLRLAERKIKQDTILEVILNGEIVEDYPDDTPFPSCLMFKIIDQKPYHVVVSFDSKDKKGYIITAYNPNLDKFEHDFRTRRK